MQGFFKQVQVLGFHLILSLSSSFCGGIICPK